MLSRRLLAPLAGALAAALASGCGPSQDGTESVSCAEWPVHTVCGSGAEVEGIDVSKWQGSIDWSGVKQSGVVFAFIRASHGTGTLDEYFDANWKGAKANGVIRGVYQYFNPGEDPIAQAKLLVQMVNDSGGFELGDLPAVIDVESTDSQSAATIMANVRAWIDYVEAQTQRRPIVYTGSYFWDDNGLDDSVSSYPLWTAHYTTNPCPLASSSWAKWTFWQYTDSGAITGISGNVDRDVFDGTADDLQQFIADSYEGAVQPDAGAPDAATDDVETADVITQPDATDEPDGEVVAPDAADDIAEQDAGEDVELDGADDEPDARPPVYTAAMTDESPCSCRAVGQGRGASGGTALMLGLSLGVWALRRKR